MSIKSPLHLDNLRVGCSCFVNSEPPPRTPNPKSLALNPRTLHSNPCSFGCVADCGAEALLRWSHSDLGWEAKPNPPIFSARASEPKHDTLDCSIVYLDLDFLNYTIVYYWVVALSRGSPSKVVAMLRFRMLTLEPAKVIAHAQKSQHK